MNFKKFYGLIIFLYVYFLKFDIIHYLIATSFKYFFCKSLTQLSNLINDYKNLFSIVGIRSLSLGMDKYLNRLLRGL